MSSRTRASSPGGTHAHYARYLDEVFAYSTNGVPLPADRMQLVPVQVEHTATLDRLCLLTQVVFGNVRMAIYQDNGDAPDGGALIVETASIALVADTKNELPIALTQLQPGLYWFALNSDNSANAALNHETREARGGTLIPRNAAQAYGAFPNPCPVTASGNPEERPWMFARVASSP